MTTEKDIVLYVLEDTLLSGLEVLGADATPQAKALKAEFERAAANHAKVNVDVKDAGLKHLLAIVVDMSSVDGAKLHEKGAIPWDFDGADGWKPPEDWPGAWMPFKTADQDYNKTWCYWIGFNIVP